MDLLPRTAATCIPAKSVAALIADDEHVSSTETAANNGGMDIDMVELQALMAVAMSERPWPKQNGRSWACFGASVAMASCLSLSHQSFN